MIIDELNKIRALMKLPDNMDNPQFLSQTIISLSNINIEIGMEAVKARLNQETESVRLFDTPLGEGEKKMSVAEAEKRALVSSQNEYEGWDNLREDVAELVNSIKKAVDIKGWEFRHG